MAQYEIHVEAANLRKLKAGESPRPVWRIVDHSDPTRVVIAFDLDFDGMVSSRQTFSTKRSGSAYLLTTSASVWVRMAPDSHWQILESVMEAQS